MIVCYLSLRFLDAVHLLNLVYLIGHVVVDIRDLGLVNQDHIQEDTKVFHLLDPDLIRTPDLDLWVWIIDAILIREVNALILIRDRDINIHGILTIPGVILDHAHMGVTNLDLPVLDTIRGINPLPQVPTIFQFMGIALVRTNRVVLSLLLFHMEIQTVTLLQWKVKCLSGCATMSWKEKSNSQHSVQRTLTRLQLSLKPRLCNRATEILKSKSVRSTDDVIETCIRQSQIVTKTNDSSFSSKSVSEIDCFLILCNLWIVELARLLGGGKRQNRVCQSLTLNF